MGRKMDSVEAVSAKLGAAVAFVAESIAPVLVGLRDAGANPRTADRAIFEKAVTMRGLGSVCGISAMTVYPWLSRQGDSLRQRLALHGVQSHGLDGKALLLELGRVIVCEQMEREAAARRPAASHAMNEPLALPAHEEVKGKKASRKKKA